MNDYCCTVEFFDGNYYITVLCASDIRTALRVFSHQITKQFKEKSIRCIEVKDHRFVQKQINAFTRNPEVYMD